MKNKKHGNIETQTQKSKLMLKINKTIMKSKNLKNSRKTKRKLTLKDKQESNNSRVQESLSKMNGQNQSKDSKSKTEIYLFRLCI